MDPELGAVKIDHSQGGGVGDWKAEGASVSCAEQTSELNVN